MVTTADLRNYLGALGDSTVSDESLADALAVARELVSKRVGTAPVPITVLDFCVREVAVNVYQRQGDGNGIRGYNQDGSAIFVARDVMYSVKPMLDKWVLPW